MPPNEDKLLKQVIDHEAKLGFAHLALCQLKEDLSKGDSMDEECMHLIKLFYEARFDLSSAITKLAMLKAEFGIVGNRWYNVNT